MAKSKVRKEEELQALQEKARRSKSLVFLQYLGLSVGDVEDLRRQFRTNQSEMVVAKKSLLGIMLERHGLVNGRNTVDSMGGGVAVAFGYEDEVSAAKVVAHFAKTHEVVQFFGGFLEGDYLSKEEITALSALPTRKELWATVVGSLRAPISGLHRALQSPLQGLVMVLQQRQQQLQ